MASDASGGRRECDKGSGSCPCCSGHHPQLEDKVCIPNAFVDANSSGAGEAAANEPKERRGKSKNERERRGETKGELGRNLEGTNIC